MSDLEFDQLYQELRIAFPDAPELKTPGGGNRMLSLDTPMVADFVLPHHLYLVQPKIDGVSLALRYTSGNLVAAWTRSGRDVLRFVRGIDCIPKKIVNVNVPDSVEIRGELWSHDRNVVAQRLRGLNNEPCIFTAFSVINLNVNTEISGLFWLVLFGFDVIQYYTVNGREINSGVLRQWPDLPTDGTVIKDNCKKYQRLVGSTSRAPLWALAVKYADQFD